ncbi:four helix bundle protein [Balneolaceae bacterium YR4-1]|uniref:Four helix bundle protein n=1 Tax=Halalkalibaculum roseum TaxID=2709311 RepID=A0A6M1TBK6_9BACT|nr:four helix bundle protein [Halalkalibaculum roseum]
MSYKNLEIWKLSREVTVVIHEMSMLLPKYELYETGSQVRRSSKSIRSNIVEGYGRRRYKQDFIKFLIYAHSSVDETRDHIETLYETKSLADEEVYKEISIKLDLLGKKLYQFIQSVETNHKSNS